MSRAALVVVILALLAGALLRIHHLGAMQMSADEGATWAAADAPSIGDVFALQRTHNPGKLPLHDLMLHGWIALFGDGLAAMRSLSVLFGLATIVLMVPLTREIFRSRFEGDAAAFTPPEIDWIATIAAAICAVSLIAIKYDRDARMYAPMLALTLAHLWYFLRSLRHRSLIDYVVLALLTSALVAINPVTLLVLVVEGIWLFAILVRPRIYYRHRIRSVFICGAAIFAGLVILAPALYVSLTAGREAVSAGKFDWLMAPPWWEPAAFFNKASGSVTFPVLFALAAWGVWRGWRRARGAVAFTLLVMWAPPLLLVLGSLLWRPMFIERYAIYSFPAFFVLIALGIWELDNNAARAAAAVAVVALSLGHIYSYSRKTHDVDWREAARVAQAGIRPDETIAVAPAYAVEVVRYYAYRQLRGNAVSFDPAADRSAVAILAEHGVNAVAMARIHRDYPHVLERASGVVVLSR